jgi:formylglycine-generating enzyme required for sulfatase activity
MVTGKSKSIIVIFLVLFAIAVTGCTDDGAKSGSDSSGNSIDMEFVEIGPGNFKMGTSKYFNAQPIHEVRLENAFYMSKYEVTQKQWEQVMGSNPSASKGENQPVESVSWNDVQEFIAKLNEDENANYRLPTETEWEYAARAGTSTSYSFGEIDEDAEIFLGDYAWYQENSYSKPHNVGEKAPNAFGLYDMHGNVMEYVQDSWVDGYQGAYEDGRAIEKGEGTLRVIRGGSWSNLPKSLESASRNKQDPRDGDATIGFRLAMDA